MVAFNPWGDRRPERAHNGTAKTVQSMARDRATPPVLTYCITVSGTSYPWEQPKRRYCAAIRKLGVG